MERPSSSQQMKGRRDQFAQEDIEQMKAYTTLELRLLARMMGDLRMGFEETGLHLRHWHGAGAAASALIESQKLKMHYGPDIAASNISPQQTPRIMLTMADGLSC